MSKVSWEDICTNCGLCCHEKAVDKNFLLIDTNAACSFYDSVNKRCKVYDKRFEKCSRCLKVTPWRACFASYLPSSCAYVRWAEAHHIRFARKRETITGSGLFG